MPDDVDVLGPYQYKDDILKYEDFHCKNKTVVKEIPLLIKRYFDFKMIPPFQSNSHIYANSYVIFQLNEIIVSPIAELK